MMFAIAVYFGVLAVWLGGYFFLHRLREQNPTWTWVFRVTDWLTQVIVLLVAILFEWFVRPGLAEYYRGLEIAFLPRLLVFGLPTGCIFGVSILCATHDNYIEFCACPHKALSATFWWGFTMFAVIPPLAVHPVVSTISG